MGASRLTTATAPDATVIGAFATLALLVGLLVLLGRIRLYTCGIRTTGQVVGGRSRMEARPGVLGFTGLLFWVLGRI